MHDYLELWNWDGTLERIHHELYVACDCRRTAYFTEQLYAALTLIDRGTLSAGTRGSMHGETGHTQFLPKNILNYGTGEIST